MLLTSVYCKRDPVLSFFAVLTFRLIDQIKCIITIYLPIMLSDADNAEIYHVEKVLSGIIKFETAYCVNIYFT